MTTYLDRILAAHRARAAADGRDLAALVAEAAARPPGRRFGAALTEAHAAGRVAVVAEIKRRSPSKGPLAPPDLDPAALARAYEQAGAACLSVLTDEDFFGGSTADLQTARAATARPVLRKDFTVCEADVCDARLMGADCVLLIAAALTPGELRACHDLAVRLGFEALVEVHDEAELEVAMAVGATLVGVNQRDLVTFAVDTERALRMAAAMPDGVVRVAESGVRGPADAARLVEAGYHGVLVGEAFVTAADPGAAVAAMVGADRG